MLRNSLRNAESVFGLQNTEMCKRCLTSSFITSYKKLIICFLNSIFSPIKSIKPCLGDVTGKYGH